MNHTFEHDDDQPVGRILTRREVLALFGGVGASALLAACGDATTTTALNSPTATTSGAATTTTAAGTTVSGTTAAATSAAATTAGTTGAVTMGASATQSPLSKEGATATAVSPTAGNATTVPATTVAGAAPACVVKPEQTEGPYFVDEKLNRSDIRPDPSNNTIKAGVPLTLSLVVSSVGTSCAPLKGAQVDIWHCDAAGTYSDTNDPGWNTVGQKFLRGYQVTDDSGTVKFTSIYPGWYRGRAVHIHFKIRTTGTNGQAYEFTSQWFFDDNLSTEVFKNAPYSAKGQRDTFNSNDGIYKNGGNQLLLAPSKSGDGYTASFGLGLDLSDTSVGKSDSAAGGGGAGGPGGGGAPGGPGGGPPPNGTPPAGPSNPINGTPPGRLPPGNPTTPTT